MIGDLEKAWQEVRGYHGCLNGDCPHGKQSECFRELFRAGWAKRDEVGPTVNWCGHDVKAMDLINGFEENVDDLCKQLAAATQPERSDEEILRLWSDYDACPDFEPVLRGLLKELARLRADQQGPSPEGLNTK